MKRFFFRSMSLIIAVFVLASLFPGALAESPQLKTTKLFVDFLDTSGTAYTYGGVVDDSEEVITGFTMNNFDFAACYIYFAVDGRTVSFRLDHFMTASAGKNEILSTLNDLNYEFRFAKFVYDESDSSIWVKADMFVDEDNCVEWVSKFMTYLYTVLDDDYTAQKLHSLE